MTLIAPVRGERNLVVGHVRIEAELSPEPRFYWGTIDSYGTWHEADSLQEATARALGYRDLADANPAVCYADWPHAMHVTPRGYCPGVWR